MEGIENKCILSCILLLSSYPSGKWGGVKRIVVFFYFAKTRSIPISQRGGGLRNPLLKILCIFTQRKKGLNNNFNSCLLPFGTTIYVANISVSPFYLLVGMSDKHTGY